MSTQAIEEIFVQEFVLGFGFLSGLWIYSGVNPQAEISRALISIISTLSPLFASSISLIFWVIPILVTIGSLLGSFVIGGWMGIIAVFLAFLGGIFIGSVGIFFLIVAVILGLFAPSSKNQYD